MNTNRTWPEGDQFHKRYPTAAAAMALARSRAAQAAGVLTPQASPGPSADILSFLRIQSAGVPEPTAMIATLLALRRMSEDGLTRFDPFLRITNRLSDAPPSVQRHAQQLIARDRALDWPASGVVHGDFHPGQVIQDQQGKVWLIDLDDLALAPIEADLGNLAGWMATQHPAPLSQRLTECEAQVQELCGQLGENPDTGLMAHFASIAVLRRALKMNERGADWALAQLSLLA